METNEKLIELVRKSKCLYDLKDKYYRNTVYKMRLWVKIAQEMNMTNDAVKHKWKVLRDGYVKYKKQLAGQTGSDRKNVTFIWSEQLSFLDDTIKPRSSKTNFIPQTVGDLQNNETQQSNYSGSETSVMDQALNSENVNDTVNLTTSSDTQTSQTASTLMSTQELETPNPPPAISPAQEILGQAQTRNRRQPESDIDKALKYLQSKNRPVHDGIDHLFLSYASTFKTLSRRKQTELKVKLATIFAEAEFSEIEETPVPSPAAYSFVAQGSSSTLLPQDLTSYRNDSYAQNLSTTSQPDLFTSNRDQYNLHDALQKNTSSPIPEDMTFENNFTPL